ncbi:MAG TPA: hypothetical protein VGJ77_20025 [Gaiellaceae bacterium]
MTHRVAAIAGDGARPEVIAEARKVVDARGRAVCRDGTLTRDLGGSASTSEVGDAVVGRVLAAS